MRFVFLILVFTCCGPAGFSSRSPHQRTISGRVMAYSSSPVCLNGNGYWSLVIRVEGPKKLRSQLIRVDFSLPCDRFPGKITTNSAPRKFRLVREKNLDYVLSGQMEGETQQKQSLPIWKRPEGSNHDALPFGQMIPGYRSVDLPLEPVL